MRFLRFMNTPRGRTIRVAVGLLVLVAAVMVGGWPGVAMGAFSLLMISIGVAGVCPISPLFGESARCSVPRRATNAH